MLTKKKRGDVTKKTSLGSIASAHPTPFFQRCTDPGHFSGGLSNDMRIGCAQVELAGQHERPYASGLPLSFR